MYLIILKVKVRKSIKRVIIHPRFQSPGGCGSPGKPGPGALDRFSVLVGGTETQESSSTAFHRPGAVRTETDAHTGHTGSSLTVLPRDNP